MAGSPPAGVASITIDAVKEEAELERVRGLRRRLADLPPLDDDFRDETRRL